MPSTETKYFGTLIYAEESVFEFPAGLPAFELEKHFVLIESPERAPLVFLQSLTNPGLCFLAFPILVVDRNYQLGIVAEDLAALDLETDHQPDLTRVLVLVLVSLHDGFSPTANLMAPIVMNLRTRRALQAIRFDTMYSYQHSIQTQDAPDLSASKPALDNGIAESCCACYQPGAKPGCCREEVC